MSPCLRQLAIGLVLSSFTSLTVQANPLAEEQLYDIACSACHSLGQTPDHHIGPPLGGLLNRPAGAVEGYRYSEALRSSGWRGRYQHYWPGSRSLTPPYPIMR